MGVGPHVPGQRPAVPVPRVADDADACWRARPSSVELGTGILVLPLRSAAVLAKTAATLDIIADGRLTLGMAVGWYEREFDACGVPVQAAGADLRGEPRAAEGVLDRRARQRRGARDPVPQRDHAAPPAPRPGRGCWSAATSTACSGASARSPTAGSPTSTSRTPFRPRWQRIREHAEAAGRDPDELDNVAQLPLCIGGLVRGRRPARAPVHRRLLRPAGLERVDGRERDPRHAGAVRRADRRQAAAGVQHICLVPYGYEHEQVERFAAEVMPLVADLRVGRPR